jgi:Glycosyl hydrolases family 28
MARTTMLSICLLLSFTRAVAASSAHPHPQPSYMLRSPSFTVEVRGTVDAAWKPVDVIADINGYHYAHFSTDGATTIRVTALAVSSIPSYSISPKRDNITGTISANTLTYAIPADKYTIVWISGKNAKLIVAADPPHTPPSTADAWVFNVMSYAGIKNDRTNISNTTAAIQRAIDDASLYGGTANSGRGIVYVPAGAYAVGNLILKPEMELYMAEGSAFWFANNVAGDQWNYTYRTDWTTKGNGTRWITTQNDASNIRIWGRGTFDGNGLYQGTPAFYNNILVFNNNHHVIVDGVVIKGGSKWGTLIGRSDDVLVDHVKFFQHLSGVGEDDALDVIESQNVTVRNSVAASFDDPYSVKTYSGTETYVTFGGDHENATDILFDNDLAWTGCHAFKIGQGAFLTTDRVTFSNSVVYDAAHAVSLHHKAGAGTVQNITWDHIDVEKISQTNLGRSWAYFNIEDTGAGTGPVKNITISKARVRDFGTDNSPVNGWSAAASVDGIYFRDVYVGPTGAGFYAQTPADAHVVANGFVSNLQFWVGGARTF